jgi:Mg-chelatase subunit ChlI
MGVNYVEREGISFSHPAQFILVGTMNPEEGELRPQLLDRFALCVEIRGLTDARLRMEVLERRVQFDQDPEGFREEWLPRERMLTKDIAKARALLPHVEYDDTDLFTIAQLTAAMKVDGHRSDIVILKSALANAAFCGRTFITEEDILAAAELALPHRMKRQPFQDEEMRFEELKAKLEEAQAQTLSKSGDSGPSSQPDVKKKTTR